MFIFNIELQTSGVCITFYNSSHGHIEYFYNPLLWDVV